MASEPVPEPAKAERDALRDLFASAALTGLLANKHTTPFGVCFRADCVAHQAHELANAMLIEREKHL